MSAQRPVYPGDDAWREREQARRLLPFEGYLEFNLSHDDLVELFAHAEAHPDWRSPLRALVRPGGDYPAKFRFSVLQILPKTMPAEEVIQKERLYKRKLGRRAKALNLN